MSWMESPRTNKTMNALAQNEYGIDARTVQSVWTSIKDRIYQRSFNFRHTYRELDAMGTGKIPIDVMLNEMVRAYQLDETEKKCVRMLLVHSDLRKDGVIDFTEFCEMLKTSDHSTSATLSDADRKRFQQKGLMDGRMQNAVLNEPTRPIEIKTGLPTNELGAMSIECPYGVLGDSERMDACIATYLNIKYDHLREVFHRHDGNKDGFVTYVEFHAGMKELDHYIFDEEIKNLLHSIDKKRKGLISVEEFAKGAGQEYLKKKAHRSTGAFESPFVWNENPVQPSSPRTPRTETGGGVSHSPRVLKKAGSTRAADLRTSGNRARLQQMMDKEMSHSTKRAAVGTHYTKQSPRLPAINA